MEIKMRVRTRQDGKTITSLKSVSQEVQSQICTDILKYLKGEVMLKDINTKYGVSDFVTQKLMSRVIGVGKWNM